MYIIKMIRNSRDRRMKLIGYSLNEEDCISCIDLFKSKDKKDEYEFKIIKVTEEQFFIIEKNSETIIPEIIEWNNYYLPSTIVEVIEENLNDVIISLYDEIKILSYNLKIFDDSRTKKTVKLLKKIKKNLDRDDYNCLLTKIDNEKLIKSVDLCYLLNTFK